jgi:hypothetical protein
MISLTVKFIIDLKEKESLQLYLQLHKSRDAYYFHQNQWCPDLDSRQVIKPILWISNSVLGIVWGTSDITDIGHHQSPDLIVIFSGFVDTIHLLHNLTRSQQGKYQPN